MFIYQSCYQRITYPEQETEMDGLQKLFQSEQPGWMMPGPMEDMSTASLEHSPASSTHLPRESLPWVLFFKGECCWAPGCSVTICTATDSCSVGHLVAYGLTSNGRFSHCTSLPLPCLPLYLFGKEVGF